LTGSSSTPFDIVFRGAITPATDEIFEGVPAERTVEGRGALGMRRGMALASGGLND
jgi:hypothetical protein